MDPGAVSGHPDLECDSHARNARDAFEYREHTVLKRRLRLGVVTPVRVAIPGIEEGLRTAAAVDDRDGICVPDSACDTRSDNSSTVVASGHRDLEFQDRFDAQRLVRVYPIVRDLALKGTCGLVGCRRTCR